MGQDTVPHLQLTYYSTLDPAVKALEFTGQTTVTKDMEEDFPVNELTVSFWIKTTDNGENTLLFSYGEKPDDMSRRLWLINPSDIDIGFGASGTGSTGIAINDGQWHNLAFELNPSDNRHYGIQIFKDGVLEFKATGAISHPVDKTIEASGKIKLGSNTGSESGFTGFLSEFCIWNRNLTADEIITFIQIRMDSQKENLVLYWALDSLAACGELKNGQFIQTELEFRKSELLASWSEITGANYDLLVENAAGNTVFEKYGNTGLKETVENYYVNKLYQAKIRAVIDGDPGEWSPSSQLRVLNLQKINTFLKKDELQVWLLWKGVDQAQSYIVEKFKNGNVQPESTIQTERKSNLTDFIKSNDWWQFGIKAFSEGSVGPASDIGSTGEINLDFHYVNNGIENSFLQLSWNVAHILPEFFYVQIFDETELQVPVYEQIYDNSVSLWKIHNPDIVENKTYMARIRGIGSGTVDIWSPIKELTVYNLAAPLTWFEYNLQEKIVYLKWNDIRTQPQKDAGLEVKYKADFYRGNEVGPFLSIDTYGLQCSVSQDIMLDDREYRIRVSAFAKGSQGEKSSVGTIDVPAVNGFWFDFNDEKIHVLWAGIGISQQGYITVQKSGAAADHTEFINGSDSGNGLITYMPLSADNGDRYLTKIRAMVSGFISGYSQNNPVVTINKMISPVIESSPCNAADKTISAAWFFEDSSFQDVFYNLELWDSERMHLLLKPDAVTSKSYKFQDIISSGNMYNLRVQALAGGSLGKWSSFMLVPCIGGIAVKSNPQAEIMVSWSRVNGAEKYNVSIYIDDNLKKTYRNVNETLVTFHKNETKVENGSTYDVRVEISVIKSEQTSQPSYLKLARLKIEPSEVPGGGGSKAADPVDVATGAYQYAHEDIGIDCVEPLRFIVYYGTDIPTPQENGIYDGKPLGYRWNHSYNTKLVKLKEGKELGILWGNGDVYKYAAPDPDNSECQPVFTPRGYSLTVDGRGNYILTKKDQYKYCFSNEGRLLSISSPCDNTITLLYSRNQLSQIKFTESIFLNVSYNDQGLIIQVTDSQNRSVKYFYEGDNLTAVTNVMGKNRTFEYYDNSRVKAITDENGHTFIKNVYDSEGRVIFQQDARAIDEGKDYGSTFSYTEAVEDGLEIIVTNLTDRSGNTIQFKSYKTSKCMKNSISQLGTGIIKRIERTYDGFANLLSETVYEGAESLYSTGMGNTNLFTYDQYSNLITETDPLGQSKYYSYDRYNNVKTETDKLGNTKFYYYEKNLITKITDYIGRNTIIEYYDSAVKGLVKTVTDSLGNIFSFKYSGVWMTEAVNPFGEITRFTYDSLGRPEEEAICGSDGNLLRTTYMEYDCAGNITRNIAVYPNQTLEEGYKHTYFFDNLGNRTGYSDPENNRTIYRYDANDFLKEIIYPTNNGTMRKTVYEYDPSDNLIKTVYSPSVEEQFTYDGIQRLLNYTDANNHVYQLDYRQEYSDKEGNYHPYFQKYILKYPYLDPSSGNIYSDIETYDPIGRLTEFQDKAGNIFTIAYNKADVMTNGINEEICYTLPPAKDGEAPGTVRKVFDPMGHLLWIVNEKGRRQSVSYDVQTDADTNTCQQIITICDPLENKKILFMDALGRLAGYKEGKDEILKEYTFQYDALGRLISTGEKMEEVFVYTNYTYQYNHQTKHMHVNIGKPGDNSNPLCLEYNGLMQLVKETRQDGNSFEKTYTPWGELNSFTNGKRQVMGFEYDEAGRFNKIKLPGEGREIIHVLDGNGNRTETRLGDTLIKRCFDNWNRLKSRQGSDSKTIGYEYTPLDLVKTVIYSDKKAVDYEYDHLRSMVKITDWDDRITACEYDAAGNLIKLNYPNGSISAMGFDDAERLISIEHKKDDRIISKTDYTLDACGNRKTAEVIHPMPPLILKDTHEFSYNASNQAVLFNGQSLDYDANGSLLGIRQEGEFKNIGYDEFNRVIEFGEDSYSYDADGLRISAAVKEIKRSFVYDINHYSSPMSEMAGDVLNGGYGYEWSSEMGNTFWELMNPGGVDSLFDSSDRILEVCDEDDNILCRYVYGMGLLSGETAGGDYQVYHYDGNGNTLALTDILGIVTNCYSYDLYGMVQRDADTWNPFLYTGRYGVYDDDNGLIYMRARSYSPFLMRFIQEDILKGSLFTPQSLNRYMYGMGNPVLMIDPMGLSNGKDFLIGGITGFFSTIIIGSFIGAIIAGSLPAGAGGAAGGIALGTIGESVCAGTAGGGAGTASGGNAVLRIARDRMFSLWRKLTSFRTGHLKLD